MDILKLEATDDLPCLLFDGDKGIFEISKRSLPENAIRFYEPYLEYINNYLRSPKEKTQITFHFDYISTSSTKQIMKMIMLFDQLKQTNTLTLNWNYDKGDVDMMQTGKRLEQLTSFKFVFNEI